MMTQNDDGKNNHVLITGGIFLCPMCGRDLAQIPVKNRKTDKGQDVVAVFRCGHCHCDRVTVISDPMVQFDDE